MTFATAAMDFFTYESRLASFQTAQPLPKRRASNASTKGPKSLKWPHKSLSGEDFANAGFFFHPTPTNPDNVVCFLCHKAMDGWEEGDDALSEHLRYSPDCGWAITASIEAQDGTLSYEYPLSEKMIEARKATFADQWPHDAKKGWKCKTKQLVEAGWKYTPTPEYDDMATCAYCALALDGWEPADKPMDEHHKRSPDCPFFTLVQDHKQAVKKPKSKRVSKASRLSTQSAVTEAEDLSMIDVPAHEDDSILTTATTATSKGRKMAPARKATTTKGRKAKAKKDEPVEVEAMPEPEPEDADFEVKVEPVQKTTRGKKRKSDEVQDSIVEEVQTEAPPPKKRATRTRASTAVDDSVLDVAEVIKPKAKKGRVSRAKKASMVPEVAMDVDVPNDEEIEKELQADLEKYASENEAPAPPPKKKTTRGSKVVNEDHAMFGVGEAEIDEQALDAELAEMEAAVIKPLPKAKGAPKGKTARKPSAKQQAAAAKKAAEEEELRIVKEQERRAAELASQQVQEDLENSVSVQLPSPDLKPKKQRATKGRTSQKPAARTTRGSVMSVDHSSAAMPGAFVDESKVDSGNESDASMASQATVVRGGAAARRVSTLKKAKGGKKVASKKIEEIIHTTAIQVESFVTSPPPTKGTSVLEVQEVSMAEDFYTPAPEMPTEGEEQVDFDMMHDELEPDFESTPARSPGRPQIQQTLTAMVENMSKSPAPGPSKDRKAKSKSPIVIARDPTPPPREPTASQSPQSSDAENHPPSSRPSFNRKTPTPISAPAQRTSTPRTTTKTTRIPLAETSITRTPTQHASPSKRYNTISGLQSSAPWTAVDLDELFSKDGDENGLEAALQKAKEEGLTSPEKKMTVEEWIVYNAGLAEEKLKRECEAMVGAFEKEGGRAMRALEGIAVLE